MGWITVKKNQLRVSVNTRPRLSLSSHTDLWVDHARKKVFVMGRHCSYPACEWGSHFQPRPAIGSAFWWRGWWEGVDQSPQVDLRPHRRMVLIPGVTCCRGAACAVAMSLNCLHPPIQNFCVRLGHLERLYIQVQAPWKLAFVVLRAFCLESGQIAIKPGQTRCWSRNNRGCVKSLAAEAGSGSVG